jgi:hypothetical protein
MALTDISLTKITEADLQRLIAGAVSESLYIDYKATKSGGSPYGNSDADHKEFLADISSFANAVGGDLVIGMAEKDGVPTGFSPFTNHPDEELRRLDDMARTGLQPRISNLTTHVVQLAAGGFVIIMRIPRSYNSPHRITKGNSNRFWARSSASPKKYEPNVEELRSMFTLSPQLADKMRDFRIERIAKIAAGETPVSLIAPGSLVLHVVPFSHFGLNPTISFAEVVSHPDLFATLKSRYAVNRQVNFDGFVISSNASGAEARQRAYTQVFRNGAVEAVTSVLRSDDKLDVRDISKWIVQYATMYVASLKQCGAEAPYAIMASLVGVKGKLIMTFPSQLDENGLKADRDQLHLTEVILEKVPSTLQECGVMLRPLLDQLANASGAVSSPNFDEEGNYVIQTGN